MISCLVSRFCRSHLGDLEAAGKDCKRLAEETLDLVQHMEQKTTSLITFSQDVQAVWSQFQEPLTPATFVQLQELVNNQKLSLALDVAMELDDVAVECAHKTEAMTRAMNAAIDCLPVPLKEELQQEQSQGDTTDDDDEQDEEERDILAGLNQDIKDVQGLTKAIHDMNIFTAATCGRQALEGLLQRVEILPLVLGKIKDLTTTIARFSSAFYLNELNCCIAFQAIAYEANGIFKSLRASQFVQQLVVTMQRLVQAVRVLLEQTSQKVPCLSGEFLAARKIKTLVHILENPLAGFRQADSDDGATQNTLFDDSSDDESSSFVSKLIPSIDGWCQ